ncbi:DNA polymerase III subunit chi [Curvivirga aplysinae]|uniref:DNA polymerase III subunit chi n=1 Tax=Curvivirga aplysinae TaxID=2529852 RepID=UPI0012BBAD5C|nr:DNA polymerase III subunit chi [Curvivirga aplysinae]MTI10132.1 DNA polymerase III subunit chi [Curvivirga aplysinae]
MSETMYYHLQTKPLEQALPQLLAATLKRGWKAVVMTGEAGRVEALTEHLWSYEEDSFLPHGNTKDGNAELQPIWFTDQDENPNQAEVLFLVDSAESQNLNSYARVCRIFNGNDDHAVQQARLAWKTENEAGRTLTYWQQTDQGAWTKKADANTKESP